MIYRLQPLSWAFLLCYPTALARNAYIEAVQGRNLTFGYASSVSGGEEQSITSSKSQSPGNTLSPIASTNSTSFALSLAPTVSSDQTKSGSNDAATILLNLSSPSSTLNRNLMLPWNSLSSGSTLLSGSFAPSRTPALSVSSFGSNSNTNSSSPTITSTPTDPSATPSCQQGRKDCDSNTNTVKTKVPQNHTTSTSPSSPACQQGRKGCDSNTNTIKTEVSRLSTSVPANVTSYYYPNSTIAPIHTTSCDVTLSAGEPSTFWIILPNTVTTTITVTANLSTSFSTAPEFTPPVYCYPSTTDTLFLTTATAGGVSLISTTQDVNGDSTVTPHLAHTSTVIVTSKNPVTVLTTESSIYYPGRPPKTEKQTVTPTIATSWGPLTPPSPVAASDATATPHQPLLPTPGLGGLPTTTIVGGASIVIGPSQVVVGGQTIGCGGNGGNEGNAALSTVITANGQTFTVNPSQVIGPGVTLARPPLNGCEILSSPAATPTTIAGISVQLAPSFVVVEGQTFPIGPGSSPQTTEVNGQSIVIGPQGLQFTQTTVAPPLLPTNVVVVDPEIISVIGDSQAVIGGTAFFYGPSSAPQTDVLNGETITIGPSGVKYGSSVLGGTINGGATQFGIAGGVSVSEIGQSIAMISGTTFIVGPGATSTIAIINGETISAGETGLSLRGIMLSYPFNPVTQIFTAGGVTFSEIGSLVNIGGTTFTIGNNARTTTVVYDAQTISLGPGGVGFTTTTVTATPEATLMLNSAPTASATSTSKKSEAGNLKPFQGVLGICIALGAGYNIL